MHESLKTNSILFVKPPQLSRSRSDVALCTTCIYIQCGYRREIMGDELLACKNMPKFLKRPFVIWLLLTHDSHFSLYVLAISRHLSSENILLSQRHAFAHAVPLPHISFVNSSSLLHSTKQLTPTPLPMLPLHPVPP